MKQHNLNHIAVADRPKLVFTGTASIVDKKKGESTKRLNASEQHLVDCYKTMIWKIAYAPNNKYRHVGARCTELNDLAEKFKTGYPWKNTEKMVSLATPMLVTYALALSSTLESVEKAKLGRDVGRVDG